MKIDYEDEVWHNNDEDQSHWPIINARQHTFFINSSPLGQNVRHFADDIFTRIFLNEKLRILIKISPKTVPKGPIDNNQHWFR